MQKIENEFFYLVNLWNEYKILFSNQDNLNILNETFGNCFWTIQHSMNNDIVLSLNRLLDPHHQYKNKNLSLEALVHEVNDTNIKSKLENMLQSIRELQVTSGLKEIRNRRLAHSDEAIRKEDANFSVILIQYDVVEKIIKMISDFLNEINLISKSKVEYLELFQVSSCQDLVDVLDRGNKN